MLRPLCGRKRGAGAGTARNLAAIARRSASRGSSSPRSTRQTAARSRASAAPGLEEGLRVLRQGQGRDRPAGDHRRPRAGAVRLRPPRSATCYRSPPSSAGRPTWWSAAAATGRAVNIKKGQFMAPRRHAPDRGKGTRHRQRPDHGHRAGSQLRLPQPGGRRAQLRDAAG